MRGSLFSGIVYIILGILFTSIAIENVQREQTWGIFTYFLILIATFDLGSGLRMIAFHFKFKKAQNKK
jgi:hypothetical protein